MAGRIRIRDGPHVARGLRVENRWSKMTADEALSAWHCNQLNILQSLMKQCGRPVFQDHFNLCNC